MFYEMDNTFILLFFRKYIFGIFAMVMIIGILCFI